MSASHPRPGRANESRLARYCRRRYGRAVKPCRAVTTMSSYHYSPPPPIPTRVLADMIVFYAAPDLRIELMSDETLLTEILTQATDAIATWTPEGEWELQMVRHGRHVQWIVWKTTNEHDESMVETYTDPDDVIAPWMIDLETLPDYRSQLPTPTLRDDVD